MTKAVKQPAWLKAALEYMPQWLEYQLETSQRPGCAFAVTHQGEVALAHCLGFADQTIGAKLRPSHRFRAASHSKSFTATGLLKLREQGRLRLDDPVGNHVGGLAKGVACLTLEQLLSHSAGLSRDGDDAGQWIDRRPFLDEADLRQALNDGLMIEPSTRFKYSNLAFGLLGLVIEEITGESYTTWIRREVVEASGLARTRPDTPLPKGTPLASGHSRLHPLGQRVAIAGDNPTHALASATGFVSTPSDLARFYTSLDPSSRASVLSAASRRD
ncbi:MAG: beta-lactamase family protein, partial [Rhodospirillaceae bacterium]|nr:beta-lactamase family protein [Rhodospirillaceae bacterium]